MDSHHRYRHLGSGLLTVLIILVNVISLYLYVEVARKKDKQTIQRQDFLVLYTAARLPASQLYNIESQRRVQIEIRGKAYEDPAGVLPFVSPPILIPFVRLIITDDYFASYWRWVAFLIGVCLVCAVLVYLITRDVLAAVTAILFIALFGSVLKGQVSPLMTVGLLLWGYFLSRGKDWEAGVSLGMLILKPHLAIALAIPMFFASRKAFAWFAGVGLLSAGLSFAFIGTEGVRDFVHLGERRLG